MAEGAGRCASAWLEVLNADSEQSQRPSSHHWSRFMSQFCMVAVLMIMCHSSDLAHHLTVVQSIRSELVAYKTHFGPLPSRAPKKDGDAGPSSSSDKPMDLGRDRDRDRDRDKGDRPAGASMNGGNDGHRRHDESVAPFTRHQDRRRDTPNGGNNRDRDRQRDDARRPNGLPSGSGRKEEDREYKRRR